MSDTQTDAPTESRVKEFFSGADWYFDLIALVCVIAAAYLAVTATLDYQRDTALEEKYDAKISRISDTVPHEVIVGNTEMKCLLDGQDDTVLLCRPLDGDTFVEPPVAG